MARNIVAVNTKTMKVIFADSVQAMSTKLGTSRTNVSDLVNGREGRVSVNAQGGNWVVA